MRRHYPRAARGASNLIMGIGLLLVGISASVLAIDLPYYFNVRNQLQTAVDAAALAGAANLPDGDTPAKAAALSVAALNPVGGQTLTASNLTFITSSSRFTVNATLQTPTIIGKFLCAFSSSSQQGHQLDTTNTTNTGTTGSTGGTASSNANCNSLTVVAGSSAEPAARDTMLVIDTSSSMDDLGNGRPMSDIKTAANSFITTIASLDNNKVDRIGLVSFNQTGTLQNGLTGQATSPGFSTVKTKISGLKLFSGVGWNTNYQTGLQTALDELSKNGRPNAKKTIIFMTDGMPNLPAPASYYSYSQYEPYSKCTDMVDNSAAVKKLCTKKNGQTICPVLPSTSIPQNLITTAATQCTQTYVDAMASLTNAQTDRAQGMATSIYTISIYYPGTSDNAQEVFRRLLNDSDWRPSQLDYMSKTTGGTAYESPAYDASQINTIYQTIAKDIHIKLTD